MPDVITFGDGSAYGYPRVENDLMAVRENWTAAQAVVGTTTGCHAAVTDNGATQVITTGFTQPTVARNVTATAGGTANNIGAISVTVTGTDIKGKVISETLPAFTASTAGTVSGAKAFASVTSVSIPAHVGTAATTAIGFGNKLGLSKYLSGNWVIAATLANVKESNAPTVTTSLTSLSNNGITLNSTLNGSAVQVIYFKHFDQTYVG